MRLIDNYLSAVAGYLPRESREDIQAELRSSLYEQLEEQSEKLQRQLTEQEQAEFLKKIGNPLKVASEYSPHRYLIGPTLFPYYMQALKGLAVVVAIFYVALVIVVAVASGEWIESMNDITGKFLRTLLTMGAFVTLGFALVDRSPIKTEWFENWNPLSLLKRDEFLAVKKGELSFDVVAEFALLLWWNGAFSLPAQVVWNESTLAAFSRERV